MREVKIMIKKYFGILAVYLPILPGIVSKYLLANALTAGGFTMLSNKRLTKLYELIQSGVLPPGIFVECGVAKGGALAMMYHASKGQREIYGFDSFEGMPELSNEDEGHGKNWVGYKCSGNEGIHSALNTLKVFKVNENKIKLVKGWFEDTLPITSLDTIALLRLDNDWYASTKYCLEILYPKLAKGGVVIIDDYLTFIGCRKAVDEFRTQNEIYSPIIETEKGSEVYWIKK